jgi:hypothetical protein
MCDETIGLREFTSPQQIAGCLGFRVQVCTSALGSSIAMRPGNAGPKGKEVDGTSLKFGESSSRCETCPIKA